MRYLLFGAWLALLLAVGLAFVHEQSTLDQQFLAVGWNRITDCSGCSVSTISGVMIQVNQ